MDGCEVPSTRVPEIVVVEKGPADCGSKIPSTGELASLSVLEDGEGLIVVDDVKDRSNRTNQIGINASKRIAGTETCGEGVRTQRCCDRPGHIVHQRKRESASSVGLQLSDSRERYVGGLAARNDSSPTIRRRFAALNDWIASPNGYPV